jgi:hypothetical protein
MNIAGPDIITDGLVLYFDAANSKCNGPSEWTDLSGNGYGLTKYYVTYQEGPSSFNFPGVDVNYIDTTCNLESNDFTCSVWFKNDSSIRAYERLIDKSFSLGFWIGRQNNIANSWGGGVIEPATPYGIFLTLEDGLWHNIVSMRSGTTHTLYGDGITNTSSNTVSSNVLVGVNLTIGNWYSLSSAQSFGGSIAVVKYYNRALSTNEVLQNFNALKTRFGL